MSSLIIEARHCSLVPTHLYTDTGQHHHGPNDERQDSRNQVRFLNVTACMRLRRSLPFLECGKCFFCSQASMATQDFNGIEAPNDRTHPAMSLAMSGCPVGRRGSYTGCMLQGLRHHEVKFVERRGDMTAWLTLLHHREEFDACLSAAGQGLVVVDFTATWYVPRALDDWTMRRGSLSVFLPRASSPTYMYPGVARASASLLSTQAWQRNSSTSCSQRWPCRFPSIRP